MHAYLHYCTGAEDKLLNVHATDAGSGPETGIQAVGNLIMRN